MSWTLALWPVAAMLAWSAPQPEHTACHGPSFDDRVRALLGPSSDRATEPWRVRTTLEPPGKAGTWVLRLELESPAGSRSERVFEAEHCDTVLAAGAWVFALAVDPTLSERQPGHVDPTEIESAPGDPPRRDPDPSHGTPTHPNPADLDPSLGNATHRDPPPPDSPASTRPALPDAPQPQTTSRPSRDRPGVGTPSRVTPSVLGLRLDGGIDGGALPGVTAELGATLGLLRPRWRLELTARGRLPQDFSAMARPDVGGRAGAWRLGLRGCGRLVTLETRLELPLCAGFEAGGVLARGRGFPGLRSTHVPWMAFLAAPGMFVVPHPRVAIGIAVEAGFTVLRPSLTIGGLGTVFRVGRWFGRALAAVELRFGKTIAR